MGIKLQQVWREREVWRDEHPVHGSEILWGFFSFSFFFYLVSHAMVFFSNIGLGGLYSKLAALEPFPVFLFFSLFIFYHFLFLFLSLCFSVDSLRIPWLPCLSRCHFASMVQLNDSMLDMMVNDEAISSLFRKQTVCFRFFLLSSFFFYLETPKTYIRRLVCCCCCV